MTTCPGCGCESSKPVRHVAWGGLLAPLLFRLVRCDGCGTRFDARTGRHERDFVPGYLRGVLAVLLLLAAASFLIFLL